MASNGLVAWTTAAALLALEGCTASKLDEPSIAAAAATCTRCHGGVDDATGAPPHDTHGSSDTAEVSVGAHTSHLSAPHGIAAPVACESCHVVPASPLSTGGTHLDGKVEVSFDAFARNGVAQPVWDRAARTCNVYCHGATLGGGSASAPVWTDLGGSQRQCGSCHGLPPASPLHPAVSAGLTGCHDCHSSAVDASGAIVPPRTGGGTHLNGVVDVGHTAPWITPASSANLEFHAYSANRDVGSCRVCHGPLLDGVGGWTNVGCQGCHDGGTAPQLWSGSGASRVTLCTGCHGGTDNPTGAPPRAIWGNGDPLAAGAHSSHVGTNPVSAPVACAECHAEPADMFAPGHVDGAVTVAFQGPISGQAGGTWNLPSAPTCSATYCHGNFLRGAATNTPSWTGTNQAACGSCHPARPLGYLHNRHQRQDYTGIVPWWPQAGQSGWVTCDQCHSGIARSVTSAGTPTLTQVNGGGPPLHVNGRADVVFELGGTYASDASSGTCSSMACHPGETMSWPK